MVPSPRCPTGCCPGRMTILYCLCYSIYCMIFPYLYTSSESIGTQFKSGASVFWWLMTGERIVYGLAALVSGYFGGKSHKKPKFIATGFLLIAGGCFLLSLTAFIAPLPEVKKDESEMWKGIYFPATKDDISTPHKLLDSYWGKKFPSDVRDHLNATGYELMQKAENEKENKTKRSISEKQLEEGFSSTLDLVRRELSFGMARSGMNDQNGWIGAQPVRTKRQMPDFEFPDSTRDRLKAGFESAVIGLVWFGDTYDNFASQVYNLTNDPEIFDRIMKSARLPFAYCRNTSVLVRDRLRSSVCTQSLPNLTVVALAFAYLASAMIGIGGAIVFSVGIPYIEDVIGQKRMPHFLAALSTSGLVLSIIGAGLGFLIKMLVYSTMKAPPSLTPIDPRWVGAWWIGTLVIAVIMNAPSLAIWKYVSASQNITNSQNGVDHVTYVEEAVATEPDAEAKEGQNGIKNKKRPILDPKHVERLFDSIVELFRSPAYVSLLLALVFHTMAMSGYFIFMPTYMENNLIQDSMKNGIVTGLAAAMYACVGIVLGVLLVYVSKFKGTNVGKYLVICTFSIFALTLIQKWLACNNVVNQLQEIGLKNPTNRPNWPSCQGCICESASFYPVCADDAIKTPYYSPCHAGCTNFTYKVEKAAVQFTFDYCACAVTSRTLVSNQFCEHNCSGVYIGFTALFFLTCVLSGVLIVPSILITLRTVTYNHRSLALGLIAFAVCIFGLLPSSILYRFVTDSSCLVWKSKCGKGNGYCEIYETNTLRDRFHGFAALLNLVACLFFGLFLYHSKSVQLATGEIGKSIVEPPIIEEEKEKQKEKESEKQKEKEEEKHPIEMEITEGKNGETVLNGAGDGNLETFINKM